MTLVIELLHQYCKLLDVTDQKKSQIIPLTKVSLEELNNHVVINRRGGASMAKNSTMIDMHTLEIDGYTLIFVENGR